jgi:hypothetical protein
MERVRRFVNDGKALLMLGGRNSFGPGGYGDTAVAAALPVAVGGRSQPQETTEFVPQLTAAGRASPVFEGIEKYFGSPSGPAAEPVPELLGCVTVPKAKDGATVLAIHPARRNRDGPLVVLAVHNYGAGRAAAFTADTTWKWYLRTRSMGTDSPYHRFWGQLVRYLAGQDARREEVGSSVVARLDRPYLRQGEPLTISAQVRDEGGQPTDGAAVTATLSTGPTDEGVQIPLPAAESGEGLYRTRWQPERAGTYTVKVTAADARGEPLGEDSLEATVAEPSRETDRLARDTATLRTVAEATRGRYVELAALPEVVDELIAAQARRLRPAPEATHVELYNFTALFAVFVGLLTAEWLIRRRWQLQ